MPRVPLLTLVHFSQAGKAKPKDRDWGEGRGLGNTGRGLGGGGAWVGAGPERPHTPAAVHGSRQEEVIDHRLTEREWAEEWKHLNNVSVLGFRPARGALGLRGAGGSLWAPLCYVPPSSAGPRFRSAPQNLPNPAPTQPLCLPEKGGFMGLGAPPHCSGSSLPRLLGGKGAQAGEVPRAALPICSPQRSTTWRVERRAPA